MKSTPLRASSLKRGKSFAASPAQREKVRDRDSITGAPGPCDPAHVWPRSLVACDHPDCVVGLTRDEHRAFDRGALDLTPYFVGEENRAELHHALDHANGSLTRLLHRLSGRRWRAE